MMYDLRVKDITFSIEENIIKCTIGRIDNMSSRTFDYVKIELLLKRGKKEELKISDYLDEVEISGERPDFFKAHFTKYNYLIPFKKPTINLESGYYDVIIRFYGSTVSRYFDKICEIFLEKGLYWSNTLEDSLNKERVEDIIEDEEGDMENIEDKELDIYELTDEDWANYDQVKDKILIFMTSVGKKEIFNIEELGKLEMILDELPPALEFEEGLIEYAGKWKFIIECYCKYEDNQRNPVVEFEMNDISKSFESILTKIRENNEK